MHGCAARLLLGKSARLAATLHAAVQQHLGHRSYAGPSTCYAQLPPVGPDTGLREGYLTEQPGLRGAVVRPAKSACAHMRVHHPCEAAVNLLLLAEA